MKKKIKDLTEEDQIKICNRNKDFCANCPLCYEAVSNYKIIFVCLRGLAEREVEVTEE